MISGIRHTKHCLVSQLPWRLPHLHWCSRMHQQLKIPHAGSCTIVWTHKTTAHTPIRVGSAALVATVPYLDKATQIYCKGQWSAKKTKLNFSSNWWTKCVLRRPSSFERNLPTCRWYLFDAKAKSGPQTSIFFSSLQECLTRGVMHLFAVKKWWPLVVVQLQTSLQQNIQRSVLVVSQWMGWQGDWGGRGVGGLMRYVGWQVHTYLLRHHMNITIKIWVAYGNSLLACK